MDRKINEAAPREGESAIIRKNTAKTPKKEKSRFDPKKMIVYSEIMKPKFDE